jgi:hypothetical protein
MCSKCTNCSPFRVTLLELGHEQKATTMRTYISTAYGIVNETIKQKRSQPMGMKYYWLQERVRQKQFDVYWSPGKDNLAEYHTKQHPTQHHQYMSPILLHQDKILNVLRGCAKIPQPNQRQPTNTHTSQRTLIATQARSALARA